MNNSSDRAVGSANRIKPAFLLTSQSNFRQHSELIKLLNFFGIPWRTETAAELVEYLRRKEALDLRLFSCANGFAELVHALRSDPGLTGHFTSHVHSIFLYGLSEFASADSLTEISLAVELKGNSSQLEVSPHRLSGLMAGVRFPLRPGAGDGGVPVLRVSGGDTQVAPVLSADAGPVFLETSFRGIPVFVTTAENLINLDGELASGVFDIREHALTALPITLYVKWAFAGMGWDAPEANACLVIDDPLLRQRYGFINYSELLDVMRRHKFATTIAFIPWNWRRSAPDTAALFTSNPAHYSISVHGCNHTAAEFGENDREYLFDKGERALRLMDLHEQETGIHHDRVMVFPHGVFSEAAMAAMKRTEFFATASSEVLSKDTRRKAVKVAEVWDVALMRYSECALFTRRSLHDGIENVAFDLLLGKPASIVIHHDDCNNGYRRVTEFVDALSALPVRLHWRGLGDALRRSCRQRQVSAGVIEVEMYGTELLLENRRDHAVQFDVSRLESDPRVIRALTADEKPLEWTVRGERIAFSLHLEAEGKVRLRLDYYPLKRAVPTDEAISVRARTLLRRYICEARDNYLTRYRQNNSTLPQSTSLPPVQRNNGSALTSAELSKRVERALDHFVRWLRGYGELSWDHQSFFAGPIGGRAKSLYYRHNKLGTAAVAPMIFFEAILPAGRRLFHRPIRFPIADAHYAMGFGSLYQATNDSRYFERAVHFLDVLKTTRCPGFTEYCWGYPFDWVTRGGTIPKDTPLITTTPYVYEAFLQLYHIDPRDEWKNILHSIVRHACADIKDFPTGANASQCSYTPYDGGGVINAAAYRAFLLASAAQEFDDASYWQIGQRNLNFVLENQSADGSWRYAADGVRDFVDHFHTCFVMKSLAKIHTLTGDSAIGAALERGVEYYCANLLDEEGLPMPFAKAPRLIVYKSELYDCAECVNLCLLLWDRFPQLQPLLRRVVRSVLDQWVKEDGSFRSRRLHFGWDNVPMHRWGQSQMFRSLAYYLAEEQRPAKLRPAQRPAMAATV